MIRGSTPTFCFVLPMTASHFSTIDVIFVQNGSEILSIGKDAMTLNGNELSFRINESDSLRFAASSDAACQIRLTTEDGTVLLSEIRRIPIRKKFPEDAQ